MTRRRKLNGYIQQKISFDPTVMARFQKIHWNRTYGRVEYGAVSQVLNGLLLDYVNRVEAGIASPQKILTDNEQLAEENL